jgi:hypothetical protein
VTPERKAWYRATYCSGKTRLIVDELLTALEDAERRAEELIRQRDATRAKNKELNRRAQVADAAVRDQIAHGSGGRSLGRALANVAAATWKERAEAAESENRRLREALDVIATCPAEAVHLMPLAAQAALAGEVPRGSE